MAYLGNVPAEAYSSIDKQVITGDGGTSYTLDHSVANENEIEVFVNNVRQEPSVAYTVSGTALTMTGNVETSDDFYVVFQGKAIQTTSHPEGQDLQARDGTFSGNLDITGNVEADSYIISGTTSSSFSPVQITSSTSGIGELRFADTTVNAGYVKYDHGSDYMVMATNATERMRINSSGNVGIGTSSPSQKLDVQGIVKTGAGDGSVDARVIFNSDSTDGEGWIGVPSWDTEAVFMYAPNGSGGNRSVMQAKSNGQVIISAEGSNNLRVDLRQGSAKAWRNVDNTGTLSTRDSYNVSSNVDYGTGLIGTNISNDYNSSSFVWAGSVYIAGSAVAAVGATAYGNARGVTAGYVDTAQEDVDGSFIDYDHNTLSTHGDLA